MMPKPGAQQRARPPHQPPPRSTRMLPQDQQEPPSRPPRTQKRRKRRRPGRILLTILLVFLLGIGAIWAYLDFSINRVTAITDYEGRPAAAEGTNWLIVGSDSRAGLDPEDAERLVTGDEAAAGGQRTDTMMLLHIPDNDTKPTLVSMLRDSNVDIPGYGVNKINAAYSFGGAELLTKTVEQNTGLRVDHYAEIGFGGFANVVDAVGGVEMCLDEEMRDTKTGITIPAGCQDLEGPEALGFVRMRYSSSTPRSDFDRVVNQRKFIGALVGELASPATFLNPFRLFPLLSAAPDALTIDEGDHLHHLVGMAWAMRGLSSGGVTTTTVPTDSSGQYWDEGLSTQLFDALRTDQPVPESAIME
ncbi:LytR family transcriptional attenuator [Tamaricihabitans halophyticus]|uniref:LytR family transcriptional attenuator n=1 Tax=Tamaricihabitans halophyticus TaxID=1262583 RepID=A0A4R2R2J4_9PSEU|nr:LytR family transcriptional attenuator [Tamaricihabitans halophyticus]